MAIPKLLSYLVFIWSYVFVDVTRKKFESNQPYCVELFCISLCQSEEGHGRMSM